MKMKKRDMKKFENLLTVEQDRLTKGIRTIGDDTLQAAANERGSDFSSFAEAGTDNNDRETALRLAGGESQMLRDVQDALKRIDDGTYGVCIGCEELIPVKRLEVFPAAKRCVNCKTQLEKDS